MFQLGTISNVNDEHVQSILDHQAYSLLSFWDHSESSLPPDGNNSSFLEITSGHVGSFPSVHPEK